MDTNSSVVSDFTGIWRIMGWKKVGEAKRTPEDQERLQRAQQEQREFEAQQRARQQESRELDWQAQQRQTAEAPAYDNLRDRAMSMSQSSGERIRNY